MLSIRQNDSHRLTIKQRPAVDYEVVGFYTEYFAKSTVYRKVRDLAYDLLSRQDRYHTKEQVM